MTTDSTSPTAVRRVAVVTAGLSRPSSTRLLADRLAAATEQALLQDGITTEVTVVELRELAHDLTDHLLTGFPSPRLEESLSRVTAADGVIAVTPIFSASYSGLFKTFFDVLEDGALASKPVLLAATAGTARHSLALEFALRPLFAYLKATTVPTAVFGASEDFGSGSGGSSGSLSARIDRAAGELADLVASRPAGAGAGTPGGGDLFAVPVPFEQLLDS